MNFLEKSLNLLEVHKINTISTVEYNLNETIYTFTLDEIIQSYMQASDEAQEIFFLTLEKAIKTNEVKVFFEKMGELLLMSQYSKDFIS